MSVGGNKSSRRRSGWHHTHSRRTPNMKSRILFVARLLSISVLAFASKTYEISLVNTTKAGNVELKAGAYRVKVNGSTAVFTSMSSDQEYTVEVKTESAAKKFEE